MQTQTARKLTADQLAVQLACCNGYLRRIGDPPVTDAIVDEIADVLELPRATILCFARYGRLTGFEAPATRTYAAVSHGYSADFFTHQDAA